MGPQLLFSAAQNITQLHFDAIFDIKCSKQWYQILLNIYTKIFRNNHISVFGLLYFEALTFQDNFAFGMIL